MDFENRKILISVTIIILFVLYLIFWNGPSSDLLDKIIYGIWIGTPSFLDQSGFSNMVIFIGKKQSNNKQIAHISIEANNESIDNNQMNFSIRNSTYTEGILTIIPDLSDIHNSVRIWTEFEKIEFKFDIILNKLTIIGYSDQKEVIGELYKDYFATEQVLEQVG